MSITLGAHGVPQQGKPLFKEYWLYMLAHAAFAKARVQQYRGRMPVLPGARASARAQGYSSVRHMQRELAAAAQRAAV